MDTIAFFNLPLYGHIRPTLPLVEHLVRKGCRVVYFIDEAHREVVAATGAEVRVLPNYTGAPEVVPVRATEYAAVFAEQTHRMLTLLAQQVKEENVGLIVYDRVCCWGSYLAQYTGLPSVRTCAMIMILDPAFPPPYTFLEALGVGAQQFGFREWLTFRKWRKRLMEDFDLKAVRMVHVLGNISAADCSIVFTPTLQKR